MKLFFYSALAATLCVSPAMAQTKSCAQEEKRVRAVDVEAQIKQDLEDFARDWNGRNLEITASEFSKNSPHRIYGARIGYFGASEWLGQMGLIPFDRTQLVVDEVQLLTVENGNASARVNYHFQLPDHIKMENELRAQWQRERREIVQFQQAPSVFHRGEQIAPDVFQGGEQIWQIVPPQNSPGELTTEIEKPQKAEFWNIVAYHVAQRQLSPWQGSAATRTLERLKELGLATIILSQEYEGSYAFAPRYMIEALISYVSDPNVFAVPDTNEIYTFNANLSGLKTDEVKASAQTVLFYEGQNEKPTFRYDGKAAICFADGHVALVTPDQAKSLIWKP